MKKSKIILILIFLLFLLSIVLIPGPNEMYVRNLPIEEKEKNIYNSAEGLSKMILYNQINYYENYKQFTYDRDKLNISDLESNWNANVLILNDSIIHIKISKFDIDKEFQCKYLISSKNDTVNFSYDIKEIK